MPGKAGSTRSSTRPSGPGGPPSSPTSPVTPRASAASCSGTSAPRSPVPSWARPRSPSCRSRRPTRGPKPMPASDLNALLAGTPVVPVLVIDSVASALPLARALVDGGLRVLEITLRTPSALDVIRAIAAEVEGAVVGAGTVLTSAQYGDAERAGARF